MDFTKYRCGGFSTFLALQSNVPKERCKTEEKSIMIGKYSDPRIHAFRKSIRNFLCTVKNDPSIGGNFNTVNYMEPETMCISIILI
jgi:hypothetical protein